MGWKAREPVAANADLAVAAAIRPFALLVRPRAAASPRLARPAPRLLSIVRPLSNSTSATAQRKMSADAAPDQPLRLARLVEMSPAAAAAAATLQTVAAKRSTSEDSRWKSVLEAQIQAIVSISFLTPRTFDVWSPGSFTATGFVVHLEETRGIVMTNKHVTTVG